MSQSEHQLLNPTGRFLVTIGILIGVVSFMLGVEELSSQRLWLNILLNNFYFISLSLIGACFIAIHYLASSGWLTIIRRVPEAMTSYLFFGTLLMLALCFFGVPSIYHWAEPGVMDQDPILAQKSAFLNTQGYSGRMIFYLFFWIVLSRILVRNSRKQDVDKDGTYTQKNAKMSAFFLITFALTFSLASIDWIMSLEPHWYSTMFPWYVFSSVLAGGTALMAMLLVLLKKAGFLKEANEHHLHDVGKYLFAFSFFWGYLWYSQYMLIWYSNIPEETHYFVSRFHDGWGPYFILNVIINLVLPFLFLLPAACKKDLTCMFRISLLVFLGHWFDFYLMIMPNAGAPHFHLLEIGLFLGFLSLFLISFNFAFRRVPMLPKNDPYFDESLHFHGT